jgi:DivIVA domain-containing protein
MLTPDRIREKTFQTTGRGSYRAEDVDRFLNDVAASYEQMFKENTDLIKKISILAKKVEEYRADEDSLKMALLNAQKLADKIVAEAKETAANEVASVKDETDRLRAEAASDAAALELNAKNESESLLANSKKEANDILTSAKEEAERVVNEANATSKEILGGINRKVTKESLVLEMMQKESTMFKQRLVSMYKEHINLINKLPEFVDEKLDKEEAEAEALEATALAEVSVVEDALVVEPVQEENIVVVEETVEDVASEKVAEVVVEDEPVVIEKPSFAFDISKIDFSDDEDETPAPVSNYDELGIIEDTTEEHSFDDDDAQAMSFKNFFKKK